ncbi:MAG: hypothetical protein U1C50_02465 [Patescibacteria group bacterium]|nr:hypothetical protein [Candidatus Beckwithbacteria bacterium]MDZ4229094.1 hypothetical protein [Patescibacteria group bacterium]
MIPRRLHKYFWDLNPVNLDAAKHPEYVIERLLNLGDLAAVKWVWDTFGRQKIVDVVKVGRQISPKTATFFTKLLNLKPEEVFCLKKASHNRPGAIWPY